MKISELLAEFKDDSKGKRGERRIFIKEFWAEHDSEPTDTDFEVGDAVEVVSVKGDTVRFKALRKGALDTAPEDEEIDSSYSDDENEIWVGDKDEFYAATKVA